MRFQFIGHCRNQYLHRAISKRIALAAAGGLALAVCHAGSASASTWNNAASGGFWSDNTATGWNGSNVPNSTTDTADFSTLNLLADNTVHLDGTYQVNKLLFGDTTASNNWVLDNNGSSLNILTLSGTAPAVTVNAGAVATISAQLASSVGFAKNGAGTLDLSNASTSAQLTSNTTVFGTLRLDNGARLGGLGVVNIGDSTGDGTITLNDSSQLLVNAANADLIEGATSGSSHTGTLNVNNSAAVTVARNLRVGGDGGANNRFAGAMNVSGGTVSVGTTLTVQNSGDNSFGTGLLNITGGSVTTQNLVINLQRQKGASVDVKVLTAGTLEADSGISFGIINDSTTNTTATLTLNSGGLVKTTSITGVSDHTHGFVRLALTGGTLQALGDNSSFISGFSVAPVIGTSGITIDTNAHAVTIPQALGGAGGKLILNDHAAVSGTLILSNSNTYTGGTTVTRGTLLVNNPVGGTNSGVGSGPVTTAASTLLGGTGSIAGATSVAGVITAGSSASVGRLTLASADPLAALDLSSGGNYAWKLASLTDNTTGAAGVDFDQLSVTAGNLKLGGASSLTLSFLNNTSPDDGDPFWNANHSWTIISGVSNAGASDFASITNANFSSGIFSTLPSIGGTEILNYTAAVPEPASIGVLALAGAGLLGRRRRRA